MEPDVAVIVFLVLVLSGPTWLGLISEWKGFFFVLHMFRCDCPKCCAGFEACLCAAWQIVNGPFCGIGTNFFLAIWPRSLFLFKYLLVLHLEVAAARFFLQRSLYFSWGYFMLLVTRLFMHLLYLHPFSWRLWLSSLLGYLTLTWYLQ